MPADEPAYTPHYGTPDYARPSYESVSDELAAQGSVALGGDYDGAPQVLREADHPAGPVPRESPASSQQPASRPVVEPAAPPPPMAFPSASAQPQPWGPAAQQPTPAWMQSARRRSPVPGWLLALVVTIVVFIGLVISQSASNNGSAPVDQYGSGISVDGSGTDTSDTTTIYGNGTVVKVAGMEFQLDSLTCGQISAGPNGELPRNGQWCQESVTVTNVSDTDPQVTASDQGLTDGKHTYQANNSASRADDSSSLLSAPPMIGENNQGSFWFDVPLTFKPTVAVFKTPHGSGKLKIPAQ